MRHLQIQHAKGKYTVTIGDGLLAQVEHFAEFNKSPLLVITDTNVSSHWLAPLRAQLPNATSLVIEAGEQHKTLESVNRIWSRLAEMGAGRDTVLVALGGGVVGDMTGFAAACWMRGVRHVQIPTTLLAQVDSAIGGKTAVDHPAGKNLIGAFHQPHAVIADTATLATLPQREFVAGIAEIVKAALLADAAFFDWLEENVHALLERDPESLVHAITRSCEIKAAFVAEDETEQGRRALLNLGHTFAHAIETLTQYQTLLHGEAVAIGILLAARLSELHVGLDPALYSRLRRLFEIVGLPTRVPPGVSAEQLRDAMRLDKKHLAERWRFIVLNAVGRAEIAQFTAKDVARVLRPVLAEATENPD